MRRYLIHLSYFGTRYRGFQKQNFNGNPLCEDPHTICGLLEIALKGCRASNHPVVVPSSRTDKGVHALSNTVHVDLQQDKQRISSLSITATLNHFFRYNDHDIRILAVQQVADDFHCRRNAIGRQYLYRIAVPKPSVPFRQKILIPSPMTELNRCCFLQNPGFDAEAVKAACGIFIGTKDFGALFSKSHNHKNENKTTIRTLDSVKLEPALPLLPSTRLSTEYDFWHFYFAGGGFLYQQVRRMVGALTRYGQGTVSLADVQRLIDEPEEKSWKPFGCIFPPKGLFLLDVLYPPEDLVFSEVDPDKVTELEEELERVINSLRNFKGGVLEKIELRSKILHIQDKLLSIKRITS